MKIKKFNQLFENQIINNNIDTMLNIHLMTNVQSGNNLEISKYLIENGAKLKLDSIYSIFSLFRDSQSFILSFEYFSKYFNINDTFNVNGLYSKETILSMTIHRMNSEKKNNESFKKIIIYLLKKDANINIYSTKNNIKLYTYLTDAFISEIDKEIPGFKYKINMLKKSDDFNL